MTLKWNVCQVPCYNAGGYLINGNVAAEVAAEMYLVLGHVSHILYWIM